MIRSYLIAAALAVAALAWILSGTLDLQAGDETPASEPTATSVSPDAIAEHPLPAVRTRLVAAQPFRERVIARGRTSAVRSVELKAELPGRITEILADKGTRIEGGEVIVQIALDDREHRLQEARAVLRQRELQHNASASLNQKGFRAETALAQDRAELDAARARVKAMEVEMQKLTIAAPFDGILEERFVELGDFVDKGTPIARILDEDPFLIVAQVSEAQVGRLRPGDAGHASLATGQKVEGLIRRIASSSDPDTRTFRVELEVPNPNRDLLEGVTADIAFEIGDTLAHFITPAILTLDDSGRIGVRTVDADNRVSFLPVTILGDAGSGVWVAGLPPRAEVITVGQELVRSGESVRVFREESGS